MTRRRSVIETTIQGEIELELGCEPDLLILRNSVGKATYMTDEGRSYHVPYGLGVGSPDLVAVLRDRRGIGVWFCLEVKADEGELSDEQEKCHRIWRRFGALIYTVRSRIEARRALNNARVALGVKAS